MDEHKNKMVDGFTKKYNLAKLVYFEETADVRSALEREVDKLCCEENRKAV